MELVQIMPKVPAPDSAEFRLFRTDRGAHLFVTDGSRLYDLDEESAQVFQRISASEDDRGRSALHDLGLAGPERAISAVAPEPPGLRSVSLNVAQACNMACHYCYADEGRFLGSSRFMDRETAFHTVDWLIASSEPGSDLELGFMGGEPLLNRPVLHETTRYAAARAKAAGRRMGFSVTTNATLLNRDDAELFRDFAFCVQVSIDGDAAANDAARPMHGNTGSYAGILRGLDELRRAGGPAQLSARATVTPRSHGLLETLDHLIGLGFDDAGFAPVVVAPSPRDEFTESSFRHFLDQMKECGRKALSELLAGRLYPFANFHTAMQEIHRGSHRPYPCGAGAGYLSASAAGDFYACHRLIDDPQFAMGTLREGPDRAARARHLTMAHVDAAEPCRSCWARYLCGGGCYHEVARIGRVGCDYIRGWLDFCLEAYVLVSASPHSPFGPEYRDRGTQGGGLWEI
jgi:uncharacterized protein